MSRKQLLAVAAFVAMGCSESSTGVGNGNGSGGFVPFTLVGAVTYDSTAQRLALASTGQYFRLSGIESDRLFSVMGATVQVEGIWRLVTPNGLRELDDVVQVDEFEREFEVSDFTVLSVEGRTAIDGILAVEDGQLIIPLAGGEVLRLAGAPEELAALVGKRVWVTGTAEGEELAYGEIR